MRIGLAPVLLACAALSSCSAAHNANNEVMVQAIPVKAERLELPEKKPLDRPVFARLTTARCSARLATAETNAALLNAPTLTASVDKQGDAQVVVSYDLMAMKTIEIGSDLAFAQCRVDEALNVASRLQGLSARALGKAGTLSRINYVDARKKRFRQMLAALDHGVANGAVRAKSRDRVAKQIQRLQERINGLRSRAELLETIKIGEIPNLVSVEHELLEAVRAQHSVQVDADMARNIRFSLSGGYSYSQGVDFDEDDEAEGFARASLSVRLGVFQPEWKRAQQAELEAALQAHYEPGRGALWRIRDTFEKNKASLDGLRLKRDDILKKIAQARLDRRQLKPDDKAGLFLNEIEMVALAAELKETEVTIAIINKAQDKLSG